VQGCFDCFLPAFHARKPFRMEYRLRRADGEYRWVDESGIPRYTTGGEFAGYIGCNIDITDRKRAERERERLRQLEGDLAHLNRVSMMGELAASLAHELNQPIAAVITSADACLRWLTRNPPDLERGRVAAIRIGKDGTRAAEIINRLRSFYKKGTPPQRELVEVNEIAREMLVLLRPEASRHSISLRTDLAELPTVMADRVQLQQVFMNLMLNAIEAMKDTAGELAIKSQLDQDGQLLISVSDTGVGLPSEKADQIFDAFFTTKPQGTGMGLAITRSIVESYGGRLWAIANAGPGATFLFTLPTEVEAHV
jgi:signal transduction histidine kinase